ncbi:sensor domain-containing diguanylate cyclase [Deinococcus navajonensis]|uniref:Diguanylate cyclase domain-containing protein n=1 Tax=Deinococcus navajonensis TaxID=309884 RepID=A0ABV8XPI2_9DEIO
MARAQKLRLKRTYLGVATHVGGTLIVLSYFAAGLLDLRHLLHYLVGITLICGAFVALILSNLNLRLRDPSMTAAQVIMTMWPATYVMYFVTLPQGRTPFMLMGVVGVLFGVFALNLRRMLMVCAVVFMTYTGVVLAVLRTAPERVDVRVETVSASAFAVVLVLITYIGSYMASLRRTVRDRNARLQETNSRLEQAMDELRELATRDHLTRLPNRRSALERLSQLTAGPAQVPVPARVCVALLDIDHFKRVNDLYGHHVGDLVLRNVSRALQDALQPEEFVGRYGGEEFLLILSAASGAEVQAAAGRIRAALAEVRAEGLPEAHRLTASIGVTFYWPGENLEATLERTDRALYRAKQEGRNCAVLDEGAVSALPEGQMALA